MVLKLGRRPQVPLNPGTFAQADEWDVKASAMFLTCDNDAATLIAVCKLSWRHLERWVAERGNQRSSDFARTGGVKRLNTAIRILKEGEYTYLLFTDINRADPKMRERELVAMMLAKAAGVIEVSILEGTILHEQFVGEGTIPFYPQGGGVYITARGAGYNPEPDVNPLFRKTIIYTVRTDI